MGHDLGPELIEKIGLTDRLDPLLAVAMDSILADALIGHRKGCATSFSLRKNFYTGLHRYHPAMTYTQVSRAIEILTGMGLIKVEKAKPYPAGRGKQSRFWATPELLALAGDQPVLTRRKGEALFMKDKQKNLIGYESNERTAAWVRDTRSQTEAIRSAEIRIEAPDIEWVETGFVSVPSLTRATGQKREDIILRPDQIELKRVANNSSWDHGMRHYGHWIQTMPKERRRQVTIGGMPVELLDFGAAHPAILYAQASAVLDGDPYDVPGFPRDEVKLALLILVNAGSRREATAAMAYRLAEADAQASQEQVITVEKEHRDRAGHLLDSVIARHQPITSSFCTGCGTRLQAIEAEIIAAVMKAAREQGIVTLPVHDELVVKAGREADMVRDLMVEKWVAACGSFPLL